MSYVPPGGKKTTKQRNAFIRNKAEDVTKNVDIEPTSGFQIDETLFTQKLGDKKKKTSNVLMNENVDDVKPTSQWADAMKDCEEIDTQQSHDSTEVEFGRKGHYIKDGSLVLPLRPIMLLKPYGKHVIFNNTSHIFPCKNTGPIEYPTDEEYYRAIGYYDNTNTKSKSTPTPGGLNDTSEYYDDEEYYSTDYDDKDSVGKNTYRTYGSVDYDSEQHEEWMSDCFSDEYLSE